MIKFENVEVVGFEAALRGMRNPKNSWSKSDSYKTYIEDKETLETADYEFFVGENDHKLAMQLRNAGAVHRKFMRMIVVYVDITAPLYWYKELDTYKVGTVANSCSTMHKIQAKEFTFDDFSCEKLFNDGVNGQYLSALEFTIEQLNKAREKFLETKDKEYWEQMIQLLPSSYNQKRTVMLSYEVLANIYQPDCRRYHKLDEWALHEDGSYFGFCDWIKTLPYSELITGEENKDE